MLYAETMMNDKVIWLMIQSNHFVYESKHDINTNLNKKYS